MEKENTVPSDEKGSDSSDGGDGSSDSDSENEVLKKRTKKSKVHF